MKKIIFGCLLLIFLTIALSCRNSDISAKVENSEAALSDELPSDFLPFYMRFFSDTTYQKAHIVFPLKMKDDSTYWQKDNWAYHVAFNDDSGEFQQSFKHINGLVFESISDSKNLFRVERRYIRTSDGYDLIYYTKQIAFENTEGWIKDQ